MMPFRAVTTVRNSPIGFGLAGGAVPDEAFQIPARRASVADRGGEAVAQGQHGVPDAVDDLHRPAIVIHQPSAADALLLGQRLIFVPLGLQPFVQKRHDG